MNINDPRKPNETYFAANGESPRKKTKRSENGVAVFFFCKIVSGLNFAGFPFQNFNLIEFDVVGEAHRWHLVHGKVAFERRR